MITSIEVDKIFSALVKAQSEIKDPKRTKEAFNYMYAPMEEVLRVAKPVLLKHGLGIIQAPSTNDHKTGVITRLFHSSGQWVESEYSTLPSKQDPQSIGSLITYFRRYAVLALLNIAPEDDDGQSAMPAKKEAQTGMYNKKPAPRRPPVEKPKFDPNTQAYNKSPATTKQKNAVEAMIKKHGLGEEISDEWFDNLKVCQASEFITKWNKK